MRPWTLVAAVLALHAPASWFAVAAGEVISLVGQERLVTASATVTPANPPGPDRTVEQSHQAADFAAFEAVAAASQALGGPTLASGEAQQASAIVGALVHADGTAAASGTCDPPVGCGAGDATSRFHIRFAMPVAMMVHIVGRVETISGAPQLRFAIVGPGVTLISDGNGGSDNIDLDALLTPGDYTLEAMVRAASGDAGAFQFDATFDAVLVGVETRPWGQVKQLFR